MNGATTRTSARTREGATRRPPPAGAPRRFARPAFGIVATIVLAAGLSGGAIAAAASAASVTPRSGTSQNTEIGTAFPGVLVATVTGLATGTKCPNLTFSAPSSGPSAVFSQSGTGTESPSPLLPTANPTGECTYQSSHLSANDTVGSYSVTASIGAGGSPGTFSLTNDGIMASAGSHQTAQDGSAFSTPLQVTVYADGAPAKGVSVSFDAPGSGPSGVFSTTNTDTATVATDATGVATAPSLTADDTAGSYTVTATTSAVPGSASFALTNSAAGVAASLDALAGSKQTAAVGTTFADPLEVKVTDANGNPVQGAQVTFAAETSSGGASGTFVGSGGTATVATDSSGVAVSPEIQANDAGGTFTVTATTAGLDTAADFTLTNLGAARIAVSKGTKQSVVVGGTFADPLEVTVKDAEGKAVQGAQVTFTAGTSSSGASGTFVASGASATVSTNSSGVAVSPEIQANDAGGTFTVTATTAGLSTAADFTLTNLGAARIAVSKGTKQSVVVGGTFADPLEVTVKDAEGKAVEGAQVTFTAGTSSSGASGTFVGSAGTATVATDSSGVAVSPEIQANDAGGTFTVTATTAGLNTAAVFTLTNLGAARIAASKGTKQSVVIGGTFADPLEVKLTNADGKPVEAAQVSFTVGSASSGASGAFATSGGTATVSTNSNGIAVSPAILANDVAGTFKVTASTAGLEAAASFILTNLAAAPASITAGAGVTQKAPVDHSFSVPLSVTVTDAQKNPVSGVDVTFRAPSSGPSGTFSTTAKTSVVVATNSSGIAVAPAFHANGVSGGYIVTASVARLSPPASFALVNQGSSTSTSSAPSRPDSTVVALAAARRGDGYWLVGSNGAVYAFGGAGYHGSLPGLRDRVSDVVGIASTPSGGGYWLVGSNGAVYAFGDAGYHGSLPGLRLRVSDIVGIASTPSGGGYWLVGSNGAVYAFGDAGYHGSLPGLRVRVSDIVGIASTPSGAGYWLVGKDGGVYAFGDAGYHGSLPGLRVHLSDVVGVASSPGGGYWLVASDGEVYGFGDAASRGSAPARGIHVSDIVGIASSPDGRGYWLAGANGRILTFGDAAA